MNSKGVIIGSIVIALLLGAWVVFLVGANLTTPPAQTAVVAQNSNTYGWLSTTKDGFTMYNSAGWANGLPLNCALQDEFQPGTPVVYSFVPDYLSQSTSLVARLYQIDAQGNYLGNGPISETEYQQPANSLPYVAISYSRQASGNYRIELFSRHENSLLPIGQTTYAFTNQAAPYSDCAAAGLLDGNQLNLTARNSLDNPDTTAGQQARPAAQDKPTPTAEMMAATPISIDAAAPEIIPPMGQGVDATPVPVMEEQQVYPPTATPLPPVYYSPIRIEWDGQMKYQGRTPTSNWCQTAMVLHNKGAEPFSWPLYRPDIMIANNDGSAYTWKTADYYTREETDEWHNEPPCDPCGQGYNGGHGVEGIPSPISPGMAAHWTWKAYTDSPDQYCSQVSVAWLNWVYVAHFDRAGKIISTEVYDPTGAMVERIEVQPVLPESINNPFIR